MFYFLEFCRDFIKYYWFLFIPFLTILIGFVVGVSAWIGD